METQSHISVPIPTGLFLDLATFLRSKGDPRDPVSCVASAIDYWLDNADWKPELYSKRKTHGYQWKGLFLPDGTELRMQYKNTYFYAKVVSDELIYEGTPTSPANLANTIASTSRNAWRDLWIKRPEDNEWMLADEQRKKDFQQKSDLS